PDQAPVRSQVEVGDLGPGGGIDMAERGEDAELRGIADEDVEPAITVEQPRREFVDLDEIAQVERNEGGGTAGGADGVVDFLETTHRARRQHDVCALHGKTQGD